MKMHTTVRKWGNSLALRLPKALAEQQQIREGAQVELVRTKQGLLLKTARKRVYRLSELVSGITPKNRHPETAWGPSVGRERSKSKSW